MSRSVNWRDQRPRLQGLGELWQTDRAGKTCGAFWLNQGRSFCKPSAPLHRAPSGMADLSSFLSSTCFSVMASQMQSCSWSYCNRNHPQSQHNLRKKMTPSKGEHRMETSLVVPLTAIPAAPAQQSRLRLQKSGTTRSHHHISTSPKQKTG